MAGCHWFGLRRVFCVTSRARARLTPVQRTPAISIAADTPSAALTQRGGLVRKERTILAIAVALAFPQLARAQTRKISGTVTIAGGGVPIAGSIISAEGTTAETRSSNEGHYRITVPAGP